MRRLEYQRKVRTPPSHARDSAEAVLVLAQIVRERRRLEQERNTLLRRIGRINIRLTEIDSTETKIVPVIKVASDRNSLPKMAIHSVPAERQQNLPKGFAEFTLQY